MKEIFKCLAGSHLYGTNTALSDTDTRGVFIANDPEYIYGFQKRIEQIEDKANDSTSFEIKKFFLLASQCNPNIVELLFVTRDKWIVGTKEWESIIENRNLFLSKKARFTFSGYAVSQLHRIKGHRNWLLNPPKKHPERKDFSLPEERTLVSKDQIGAFNALLVMYMDEIKDRHPLKTQLEELPETNNFLQIAEKTYNLNILKALTPLDESLLMMLSKEKAYLQSIREWNQYTKWKEERNKYRAVLESKFGFDTKHGAHLYRLITEGEELLSTGKITLPRPDKELLLEIRNGKYSYDELMDLIGDIDTHFIKLYETSILPHKPEMNKLDELCQQIIRSVI